MSRFLPWFIIICLFLTGCAGNLTVSDEDRTQLKNLKNHLLYVDENGQLLDPAFDDFGRKNKILRKPVGDEKAYVENILNQYAKRRAAERNLVLKIFIHGGLNTFNTARETAAWAALAASKQKNIYPLFISWDSSLSSNYKDHIFHLRRGVKEKTAFITSPYVIAEDLLRSAARLPVSAGKVMGSKEGLHGSKAPNYDIPEEEKRAISCKEELREIERLGDIGINIHNHPDNVKCVKPDRTKTDYITQFNPIKLLSSPLVDSFGTGAWSSMLRRSDFILHKDSRDYEETAVSVFFKNFQERFHDDNKKHGKGADEYKGRPLVDIMGHSMGTIVINNIIAKYPEINFRSIVFMASASRLKAIKHTVSTYMERNRDSHFYNLSLNAYRDLNESNYYDLVPRGSLLVWIDHIFAETNSLYDRTAGFWYNILSKADSVFSPQVRSRVHLTQFGANDHCMQSHGAFAVEGRRFWEKSFWKGEVNGKPASQDCRFKPNDMFVKLFRGE